MRRALDALYNAAGAVAALFLIGTLAMVLAGIISRLEGIYVRGTDAYAGYCMAAAGFLALAYTFKHGEHIRVNLVLERLPALGRKAAELIALIIAAAIAALLAYYSVRLAWQSYTFKDVSQGVDATPLWIPQLAMAAGAATFLIALLDDLATRLRGRTPSTLKRPLSEPSHIE